MRLQAGEAALSAAVAELVKLIAAVQQPVCLAAPRGAALRAPLRGFGPALSVACQLGARAARDDRWRSSRLLPADAGHPCQIHALPPRRLTRRACSSST